MTVLKTRSVSVPLWHLFSDIREICGNLCGGNVLILNHLSLSLRFPSGASDSLGDRPPNSAPKKAAGGEDPREGIPWTRVGFSASNLESLAVQSLLGVGKETATCWEKQGLPIQVWKH